jgi:protein-tyrosine-phosphatase/8-oxo-dGTP pyrophosphatase MutT (NUDIX family)
VQTWRRSAAGLIVRDRGRVLMQLRSPWVQHGGTWSIPGGAVNGDESLTDAALREAREETGLRRRDLHRTTLRHVAEPVQGWTHTTIAARLRKRARGTALASTWEATRHEWVPIDAVAGMDPHPGVAASWRNVRNLLRRPTRVLFVCLGNVCRSPLAEALLRRMAFDAGAPILVASVGTFAEVRAPMYPATAACAARHSLDGSAHVSRQLVHDDVASHDVVVALDAHAGHVVKRIADRLDKRPSCSYVPQSIPGAWTMPHTTGLRADRGDVPRGSESIDLVGTTALSRRPNGAMDSHRG